MVSDDATFPAEGRGRVGRSCGAGCASPLAGGAMKDCVSEPVRFFARIVNKASTKIRVPFDFARPARRQRQDSPGLGMLGFSAHVRQSTGHERRIFVQDQHFDGQFAGDLQAALCCLAPGGFAKFG